MTLAKMWSDQRDQLEGKHIRQILSFAGDGKLRDGNETSKEFREFLSVIPSKKLIQYLEESLSDKFDDNNLVFQDIVNQIGRRLGFDVTDGRYRGTSAHIGFDGIWILPSGHLVIIEVKTTDVYQISLETIAKYRRGLITDGKAKEDSSSILIVLGREDRDTSSLEAQIRGSRFAWDVRLIGINALVALMTLKESVDDPKTVQRISAILIPREFTKLDEIINLVFSTAEDVKAENTESKVDLSGEGKEETAKSKPVDFYDACIKTVESHLGGPLIKRSRSKYSSVDDGCRVICTISREYIQGDHIHYWFAFHPHQQKFLEDGRSGFVVFGCGTEKQLVMIPFSDFVQWLDGMNTTESDNRFYWHVRIFRDGNTFTLFQSGGNTRVTLDKYTVQTSAN